MASSYADASADLSRWCSDHSPEILADQLLHELATLAAIVLAEGTAQLARVSAELDRYRGTVVYHCTESAAADVLVTLIDASPGSVLRATDTGREWVRSPDPALGWELVP